MTTSRSDHGRIAVLHLTDTLDIGGAERMTINLLRGLPRDRYEPHLCLTRRSGALATLLPDDVPQLLLGRRHRFDIQRIGVLARYIREHDIRILHAHGTSVFVAIAAAALSGRPAVIWHIHYGRYAADRRPGWAYRLVRSRIDHTIGVSQRLASWAATRFGPRRDSVTYIPNFTNPGIDLTPIPLPGHVGARIVCVANFLPEKDHATLLDAMARVIAVRPDAHLLLVGNGNAQASRALAARVEELQLPGHVSMLGHRRDVAQILRSADIGVLSSNAEGLPLALIEYGEAALPTVVTDVGQCADVVEHGRAGLVVPPRNPEQLATALLELLASPARRRLLGDELHEHVQQGFSATRVLTRISALYDKVLDGRPQPRARRVRRIDHLTAA